ncbi:hypothetical protein [Wenyingzhuangia sp. IMCC45467]
MKRMLFFVSVLVCSLGFAQEFKFSKDLDPRNVTCIEKSGEYFTLLSEYDKYNKNYHITLFHLENDVNVLKGVYKTQDRLDLQSYHLYQNQLILVLFAQKKFNIDRYKGDDDTAKGHEIVTFNLDSNKVKNSSHSFKPDYKFSTDSKTYFLSFNNNKIYLTTISDDQNIKTSDIEFTKEQRTSISLNIKADLDVINNDNFKENIGVKKSRIYYTDKAIYLTRDGYNFKKQSVIYKVSLADGMIKNLEQKSIEYPYGKAVKDLNSYLLNDKYYLITRYKSELNLQIVSLDSIEKSVENIYLKDYEDKAVWESGDVKRLAKKLTNIMIPKVPSLMIYDLEGSDKKLVVVDDILKNTYYYDNFHWQFHQQMMQQHQMMHQQMIQNAQQQMMQNMQQVQSMRMSMPGGFYMVELPLMTYDLETRDVKLKFLINGDNEISRYNKEETSLKKYDYENALEKLKWKLTSTLKKYKSEFVSITFMGEHKIQYAYFDKFEDRLLTGVLSLKED